MARHLRPHERTGCSRDLRSGRASKFATLKARPDYLSVRKYVTTSLIWASVSLPANGFILPLPFLTDSVCSFSVVLYSEAGFTLIILAMPAFGVPVAPW